MNAPLPGCRRNIRQRKEKVRHLDAQTRPDPPCRGCTTTDQLPHPLKEAPPRSFRRIPTALQG